LDFESYLGLLDSYKPALCLLAITEK